MHKGVNTTCDEGQTMIAHSLRGEGFDASEDGTGRGTPLVPVAFAQNSRDEVRLMNGDGGIVGALSAEPGMKQACYVAFPAKDHGADAGDIAPTLRAMGHGASHANGGGQVAVAFQSKQSATAQAPSFDDVAPTLDVAKAGGMATLTTRAVRRLTPRECERLQGFPDDYTRISEKAADGPRYKALGNSMAVPVMRWIGQRINKEAAR
jgi:DNA (cytosine-5)-methyltransferase 1